MQIGTVIRARAGRGKEREVVEKEVAGENQVITRATELARA